MTIICDPEQGSSNNQISPRYADRFALPCLAAMFALVVVLYLSRAGDTALLCTRLLFTLSSAVYVAVLLLRQREEGWSWSSRAEAWRSLKDSVASADSYCRRNYVRVIYYVVIFLYGSALLVVDERADDRYVVVVSLLAPALTAMAKVSSEFRDHESDVEQGSSSEQVSKSDVEKGSSSEQVSGQFRNHKSDVKQANSSEQINPRNADRFAPPCLAALFALVVVLYLSRAGETALLYTRLLFTLSFTVYVAALLLRQREEGWSWRGRAEAWRTLKDSAASAASYCRRNYEGVIYYVVIFLYGSALLVVNKRTDNCYLVVVSLLAPGLIAMAKASSEFRDHGIG